MTAATQDARDSLSRTVRFQEPASWTLAAGFLIVLAIPSDFALEIGSVLFTPVRIYLIALFPIVIVRYISIVQGKPSFSDILYLLFIMWTTFAIIINRGIGAGLERGGQFFLEFGIVYLLARSTITTTAQAQTLIKVLFSIICVVLIFAIIESSIYRGPLVTRAVNTILGLPIDYEMRDGYFRFGLFRARTVFGHAIIMGVFVGAAFSLVVLTAKTTMSKLFTGLIVFTCTFLSLSSGPLLAVLIQIICIIVYYFSKRFNIKFNTIFYFLITLMVFLEAFTGRGVIGAVELLVINSETFHYRVLIWNQGIDDVLRNPLLGFREETWTRLFWMKPSIDNFWLLQSMRGGIPSTLFLLASMLLMARTMVHKTFDRDIDPEVAALRRGCLYMQLAFFLCGSSVHFFDKVQPFFALMLGFTAAVNRLVMLSKEQRLSMLSGAGKPEMKPAPHARRLTPVIGQI